MLLAALALAVLTALLSSALTLGLAYWLFERRLRRPLEARLAALEEQLGSTIRDRVRQGIVDGVAAIPSTEVLRGAQRTVTDSAAELLRNGLGTILGSAARRRDGEE